MTRPNAADLLRSTGLMADGPVRWGRVVPAKGPGVYLVELAEPLPNAPIDLSKVGKWLERVPGLRVDGERPTSKSLLARLASLWLSDATLLYAGASTASVGGRVASLQRHVLGDPRPHADGQWLLALRDLSSARIWWASTKAPEEYLDAIFEAFAAAGPAPARPASIGEPRPAAAILLPWANSRRPTGERQQHGITGSVLPLPVEAPTPPRRVVNVAPGDAEGAREADRGTSTTVRRGPGGAPPPGDPNRATAASASAPPRPVGGPPSAIRRSDAAGARGGGGSRASAGGSGRTTRAKGPVKRPGDGSDPVELSAEAHARLLTELDELTRLRRPDVVARIKSARELGDLKENAEYQAAREEQSFLEGRVQLLEQRLRHAVIVEPSEGSGRARSRAALGSRVTVEIDGDELTYTLVGTAEADAKAGRISTASPVGAALLGAEAGKQVVVRTPRGEIRYQVKSVE
jgi:transcription elongation factor GreA